MDLSEIRVNIDRVDKQIRELFIERMALAEQVVSVKSETGDKIFKPDREKDIIVRNSQGLNKEIEKEYQSMIKRIMEVSRKYQYGRMLDLRDCFPFEYETKDKAYPSLVSIDEETNAKQYFPSDEYLMVDSYDSVIRKLNDKEADAGIAIMEEIGKGVNDAFHHMLVSQNYYINACVVTQEEQPKKCVLFSDTLVVLPEHNRFKIMFTCKNSAGSFGGLLTMISDYGVNFTQMHSSPIKMEQGWDYMFFLELEGNLAQDEMHSLVFQLSEETNRFQLLGSYRCEGDFA